MAEASAYPRWPQLETTQKPKVIREGTRIEARFIQFDEKGEEIKCGDLFIPATVVSHKRGHDVELYYDHDKTKLCKIHRADIFFFRT